MFLRSLSQSVFLSWLEMGWDGMGWDGWMVIIGHRSSKSTFGANNVPHSRVWKSKLAEFRYFVNI